VNTGVILDTRPASRFNYDVITIAPADLDGPCSRVSKNDARRTLFTGRVYGSWTWRRPWTRVVCTKHQIVRYVEA